MQFVQIKALKTKAIVEIVFQMKLLMQIGHLSSLYCKLLSLLLAGQTTKCFAEKDKMW